MIRLKRIAVTFALVSTWLTSLDAQRVINNTLTLPTDIPSGVYDLELAFPNSVFASPIAMATPPGETNRLFVVERPGRIRIVSDVESGATETEPFLDISSRVTTNSENGLLGLAFHPNFAENRQFFVFYTTNQNGARNRISRFLASENNPNLANPNSETVFLNQLDDRANHNGGDIHFGPDGYLYAALGDEGAGNDSLNNSQLVDKDFFAGIIRIDTDKRPENIEPTEHPAIVRDAENLAYFSIPADNPLVQQWQAGGSDPNSDLRLEFYAIGLRNPWRMSFDPVTGRLWAGDVGQGAREEVDIIVKGGNYGWAFREGFIEGPKTQTPPPGFSLVDPIYDYPRSDGASITAGIVYRGANLSELDGAYIFSDFVSGNLWSLFEDPNGGEPTVERLLIEDRIASFGRDPSNGDILLANLGGPLARIVRGEGGQQPNFPTTLSAIGAFKNLDTLEQEDGIIPYETNVSFWSDHAIKQRWVSIPNQTVSYSQDQPWDFPQGSIWIKHFELETTRGDPATRKRVETRFLVKTDTGAYGISYQWNDNETEATLVPEEGVNIDFQIQENGNPVNQTWRIPSRSECMQCHTAVAGYALSFNSRQLNRTQQVEGSTRNFLEYLGDIGILDTEISNTQSLPRFYQAGDESATLESRVRSYLSVNCVSCHQPGGIAPNTWDARPQLSLEQTKLINGLVTDDGGNANRRLVVRGNSDLSVMLSRIQATHGFTRMPPLATNAADQEAIDLVASWINLMPPSDASFQEWQIIHFGSASLPDARLDADPDGDGNSNRLEFLTRTDPNDAADSWNPEMNVTRESINVSFPMAADRQFTVETSRDLKTWNLWDAEGNPPEADSMEPTSADLTSPLEPGELPVFLRVGVEEKGPDQQ